MASGKKTVELVQTRCLETGDLAYWVVKLTNTVDPAIGSRLRRRDVEALIRRPGWTVTIKEEGKR